MKLYILLSLLTVSIHTMKTIRNLQGKPMPQAYLCTGVYISPTEILTAQHCMENADSVEIETRDGHFTPAIVKAISPKTDLALLVSTATPLAVVPGVKEAFITEKVYLVGSGEGYVGTYSEGVIENITPCEDHSPAMIMHSAAIKHGSSGSGLFDGKGNLVGINTISDGSFSWAVNTKDIIQFLKDNGIKTH